MSSSINQLNKKTSMLDLQKIFMSIMLINALTACGNGSNEKSQKLGAQNQTAQQQSTANAIDTDKDGVYDALDAEPKNPWIAGKVVVTTMEHSEKRLDTIGFDAKGRETYVASVNAKGKPTSIIWRQYNTKGDVTLYKEDNNGDGKPNKTIKTDYHSNGKQKQVENINQNNQIVDRKTYNQQGKLLKEEKDKNNDGQIDWVVIHTYDNNGKHLKSTTDENGDGRIDLMTVSTYDADGNNNSVYIEDAAGKRTYQSRKSYHGNGQVQREILYNHDEGQTTTNEYDKNGNQTLKKYKSSSFSETHKYEYNEHNVKIKETKLKGDGSLDFNIVNTTDSSGKLITKIQRDVNGDGVVDLTVTQSYNNKNQIIETQESGKDYQKNDYVTKTTFKYNSSGKLIEKYATGVASVSGKIAGQPTGTEYEKWQYNSQGLKTYYEIFVGGVDRQIDKYTYDENKNMLSHEHQSLCQSGGEKLCSEYSTYKYNAQNKMTEEKKVYDNGDVAYRNSWQYADDGTLLEHKKQSAGGYEDVYKYNQKGHPIEVIVGVTKDDKQPSYHRTFQYIGTVVKAAKVIVDKKADDAKNN